MLQNDRHGHILALLEEQGSVQIAELCQLFDVSEMTVHRDLNQLVAQARLRKVRGGAVPLAPSRLRLQTLMGPAAYATRRTAPPDLWCSIYPMVRSGTPVVPTAA